MKTIDAIEEQIYVVIGANFSITLVELNRLFCFEDRTCTIEHLFACLDNLSEKGMTELRVRPEDFYISAKGKARC